MSEREVETGIKIGVYGATGALGREVLLALEGHGLPIDDLVAVGGVESAGREAYWRSSPITVVGTQHVEIGDLDVAILAVPSEAAETLRPTLIDAGVFVIDLSAGQGTQALPLVWPRLDLDALETHPGGVALPCGIASALGALVQALGTVGDLVELDVSALMSAQAVGRRGEEALSAQTVALLNQRLPTPAAFGGVLAFNLLPGSPQANAEGDPVAIKARDELARLLPATEAIKTTIRIIQVPVFAGLGLIVRARFSDPAPTSDAVHEALEGSEALVCVPKEGRMALRDTMERDAVFLADIDLDDRGVLHTFIASDPLHRSAWAAGSILERVLAEDLW